MPRTAQNIVEEALTKQRADVLWTANYLPILPITPQDFDIKALLSAMLYLARWGHRRGIGKFIATFSQQEGNRQRHPTIADVANRLVQLEKSTFIGLEDESGRAMLGDLFLAYILENKGRSTGHFEQVQRIFPTHYLASWIDLPDRLSHLRGVPELLTVLLAQQTVGEWLELGNLNNIFSVGTGFSNHVLLALFGRHMTIQGQHSSNLTSDFFVEEEAIDIGIDELLAVRTAQACGSAPLKVAGGDNVARIANRWPLARCTANNLYEDLSIFIKVYGATVPRQAFLQMLESAIALGITNLLLSTASILAVWETTGKVLELEQQMPLPLFVDCSHGQDKILHDLSEVSTAECIRSYERLPLLMMLLRVLDDRVRIDRKLRESLPAIIPDATEWINLLGDIYQERHQRADSILNALDEDCLRLADALESDREIPESTIANRLRRDALNPTLRLAEALCELMGDKQQRLKYLGTLESAFMTGQPNGLAVKRRVSRSQGGVNRRVDLRAIVLNPPVLEFLVHRHLCNSSTEKSTVPLSFPDFIDLLRERYGLYIAQEPPGQSIPQEMLLRNKAFLEQRLRDLGLLIGVNDAEKMKQLKPHYRQEARHAV